METLAIALLLPIFNLILPLISEESRKMLVDFMRDWRRTCLESANKWDDGISYILCVLLAVPIDDIVVADSIDPVVANFTPEEREILINGGWKIKKAEGFDFEALPPDHPMFDNSGG